MHKKPFSTACERNKVYILEKLQIAFANVQHVLEIGSGTGQHAVYFAEHMKHLQWQTGDLAEAHAGIRTWIEYAQLPNVLPPLIIDANDPHWPLDEVDAVFSANTLHIVSWSEVEKLFAGIGRILRSGGEVCIYGPFNYGGNYTSESNQRFDEWLRLRDPHSGIRDFEAVCELANEQGLELVDDHEMPANNRLLHWRRG